MDGKFWKLLQAAHKIAPALAVGCPFVMKPARYSQAHVTSPSMQTFSFVTLAMSLM